MSNDRGNISRETPIERFLDGDMNAADRRAFEDLIRQDDWIRRETDLARSILVGLHSMDAPEIPERVTKDVRRTIRNDLTGDVAAWLKIVYRERMRPKLQPIVAMASLLAVVLSAALLGRSTPTPEVSGVESARQEVEWTLAYLSRVSRRTGSAVRRKAIQPLVVGPVSDAVRLLSENGEDE